MSNIVKAVSVRVLPAEKAPSNDKPHESKEPKASQRESKPHEIKEVRLEEFEQSQPEKPAPDIPATEPAGMHNPANYADDKGQTLFGQLPTSATDNAITRALEESKEILKKAEMDALRIVTAGEAECAKIKEEAKAKGYEEGYLEGVEAGKEESKSASAELAKESLNEVEYLIEALKMERMQTYREEQEAIVQLSFEVAKKIMRQQIKVEKEAIPRMVEEVVKENETAVKVVLSEFNETLFTRIDRRMREKINELLPDTKVLIVPNDGSEEIFQIETINGMVDAAVSGQLGSLLDAVKDPKDFEPEEI